MDDLISRQVAINALQSGRQELIEFMDYCFKYKMDWARHNAKVEKNRIDKDIFILEDLPTITEKEGQWRLDIEDYIWGYVCSECNEMNLFKSKYCPNCGIKMEG